MLLIDLRPTVSVPESKMLIDHLLEMENRIKGLDLSPYKLLKEVFIFSENKEFSKALNAMKRVIDLFDKRNKTVMHYLEYGRNFFVELNQPEERFAYYKQKLDYYRVKGHEPNMASFYRCLAGYFSSKADFNQATSNYMKSAEIFKKYYPYKYLNELGVIGSVYSTWGNTKKALYYFEQAETVAKQLDTVPGPLTLLGIADVYFQQNDYTKSLKYLDELLYIRHPAPTVTAIALTRKANIFLDMNKPDVVLPLLQRAKQLSDSLKTRVRSGTGDLEVDFVSYKYSIASKSFNNAEKYLLDAYTKASNEKATGLQLKYFRELSLFYTAQNSAGLAKKYLDRYFALGDTVKAQEAEYNIAYYETEQKEAEQNEKINDLKKDQEIQAFKIRQRSNLLWIGGGVVLLIAALTVFLFLQLTAKKKTLASLHQTQKQLILSEKMASLGDLSAGIAHEIQNPLNFVNNFSEVNKELVDELQQELRAGKVEGAIAVSNDIKANEEKISHHGKRADAIVKSMLQHSRAGSGKKEPTDINALTEEYLRLSYHGIRDKDPGFSADIQTDFDPKIGKVDLVPQDIGRVLLNLFNNAFYTVAEKMQRENNNYKPVVNVKTRRELNKVIMSVKDNGNGIPSAIIDKIFQPFFTTKTTGEGTGLGLSMSYDIVKAHGGELRVETRFGEGSTFIIKIPA